MGIPLVVTEQKPFVKTIKEIVAELKDKQILQKARCTEALTLSCSAHDFADQVFDAD